MHYFCDKSIGGTLFVRCMEAVCISESLLWEVPLYYKEVNCYWGCNEYFIS